MAVNVGTAFLEIKGDLSSLNRDLGRFVSGSTTGLGKVEQGFKKVETSATGGFRRITTTASGTSLATRRLQAPLRSVAGEAGHLGDRVKVAGHDVAAFGATSKRTGGALSGVTKHLLAFGAGFIGISAGIGAGKRAIATTEELAKGTLALHRNLGLTIEDASRWAAVAKARGIDTSDLSTSFTSLSKNVTKSGDAVGIQVEAEKELGRIRKSTSAGQRTLIDQAVSAKTGSLKQLEAIGKLTKAHGGLSKEQSTLFNNALKAGKGAEEQTKAFKALGLTQEDIIRGSKDFPFLLQKISEGFGKMEGGPKRAALAQQLLGRSSQNTLPIFTQGAKAMQKQLDLADKYGVTLHGKTIKSVKDLIQVQKELEFAQMGLQVQFTQTFGPVLTKALQGAANFGNEIRKIFDQDDLTAGQKWDKLGDLIAGKLDAALPKITEAAGRIGPKIALAFVRGFLNAPPLVQLATGAWLFKKLAPMLTAAGLLGGRAGGAFSTGMATTVAAETGAGGAAGAAATGGLAGLGAKLSKFAKIGVGVVIGTAIAEGIRLGLQKGDVGLEERVKQLQAPGVLGIRKGVAGLQNFASDFKIGGIRPLSPFSDPAGEGSAASDIEKSKALKQVFEEINTASAKRLPVLQRQAQAAAKQLDLTTKQKAQLAEMFRLRATGDVSKALGGIVEASGAAQDALPAVTSAQARVNELQKQGKTDTHAYAEAIRALDAAEATRATAVRARTDQQEKALAATRKDLGLAFARLQTDRKLGASSGQLKKDISEVAQAASRQYAALTNVSRAMRGLTPITGEAGTKMGVLLKQLKDVAGVGDFKKFLVTADFSSVEKGIKSVAKLQELGRGKTAMKIFADSKSPEEALKRLQALVDKLERRKHRVEVTLRDLATRGLHNIRDMIQHMPNGKISVDVVAGKISIADRLDRLVADALTRAGLGQAGKQARITARAKGGSVREALTLVGEEGPELAKLPTGKMTMVGLRGPEIRELPVGTRVHSHPETKRKLASVSQDIFQRLVPAAIRQPKPLVQSVVQSEITQRFAKGGKVKKKKEPKAKAAVDKQARSKALGFAKEVWPQTAPALHAAGMPMPKVEFSGSSAMKTGSAGPGTVWVTQGKSGLDKIVGAPWFMRDLAARTYQGLHTLVHEFSHIFQLDPRNLAQQEGGAEAFAKRASPSIAAALNVPVTPTFKAYKQQIRQLKKQRGKGYDQYVSNRQFGIDSTGAETKKLKKAKKELGGELWYETGGDSTDPGRRTARTSQLAGVNVTPDEVSAIASKWSVNRAVASIGAAVKDKFPLMNIISGFRAGARTKSGNQSNHAIHAALDLGSRGSLNRRIGTWARSNFPKGLRGVSEDVLDVDHDPNPPDHADHVHVAALGSKALTKVMEAGGDGTGAGKKEPTKLRHHGRFTLGQMVSLAKRAGFPDPALAASIGFAESSGNTAAHNTKGEDSRGLWQINVVPEANPDYKDWDLSDAFQNVRAAFKISGGGKNWKPWTKYTSGDYKKFLGAAKAAPLPKGTTKGTPSGSTYADYLAAQLIDAEGTKSDPKDDIRWINRSLRYYRGVYRRNKAKGNSQRQGEAKQKIIELQDKKQTIKDELANPEIVTLDSGLAKIGTGPKAFNLAFMADALNQIDLEKANAALTLPADDDDSALALAGSLNDDIAAASRLATLWEGIKKLTDGVWLTPPTPPPHDAPGRIAMIDQTIAKERKKSKPDRERIKKLQKERDRLSTPQGGNYVIGTPAQQTEAATNLASARSELKGFNDEIGQKTTDEARTKITDRLRALASLAALTPGKDDDVAAVQEAIKQYEIDLNVAQQGTDQGAIADAAEALKGARDDLKSLTGEIATERINFATAFVDVFKQFGSNFRALPAFAKGGVVRALVGEQGFELAKLPNQKVTLVGGQGPEIRELPIGTRIYPHGESKRKLSESIRVPAFAKGGVMRPETVQVAEGPDIERILARLEKALKDQPAREVNIDARHTIVEPPAKPHEWSRNLKYELEAI